MRVKCIHRWSFASFWYEGASTMEVAMPAVRYNQGARTVGYVRVSRVGGREGDGFIFPKLQREQIEAAAGDEPELGTLIETPLRDYLEAGARRVLGAREGI